LPRAGQRRAANRRSSNFLRDRFVAEDVQVSSKEMVKVGFFVDEFIPKDTSGQQPRLPGSGSDRTFRLFAAGYDRV